MDEENNGGGVQYIKYDLKNYFIREVRYMSRVYAGKLNGQQLLWKQVPNGWPEHLKWKNPTSTPKDNVDELREKFEFLRKNIQLSDSLRERLDLFDRKNLKGISNFFYLESFSETLKNFHSVDTEEPLIQEHLKNVLQLLQKVQENLLSSIGDQSCKRKVTNAQTHDTPMKKFKPGPITGESPTSNSNMFQSSQFGTMNILNISHVSKSKVFQVSHNTSENIKKSMPISLKTISTNNLPTSNSSLSGNCTNTQVNQSPNTGIESTSEELSIFESVSPSGDSGISSEDENPGKEKDLLQGLLYLIKNLSGKELQDASKTDIKLETLTSMR